MHWISAWPDIWRDNPAFFISGTGTYLAGYQIWQAGYPVADKGLLTDARNFLPRGIANVKLFQVVYYKEQTMRL